MRRSDRPSYPTLLSRRLVMAGLAGALALPASVRAALLPSTPVQTEGPFYPTAAEWPADADLLIHHETGVRAAGEIIHVTGRVQLPDGRPVAGARVEIWQADAEGVYNHPRDRGSTAFQGYGVATTDAEGQYRFRTIKPAEYGTIFFRRTPHIHFKVKGPGTEPLVTQMYFAGEPRNARDGILNRIEDEAARARLIVDFRPAPEIEPDSRFGVFNIVLGSA